MTTKTTLLIAADPTYDSGALLRILAGILENHDAVGDDFPDARAAILANLRTLQSALPAAIAKVEAATLLECDECRQVKPDVKETTIAGQKIRLCAACLPKLWAMWAMSPFEAFDA